MTAYLVTLCEMGGAVTTREALGMEQLVSYFTSLVQDEYFAMTWNHDEPFEQEVNIQNMSIQVVKT